MKKPLQTDDKRSTDHAQLRRSLEQSRIFGDLGDALISNLVDTMTIEVIPGGEKVFVQGDESKSLLVVVSGRLLARRLLEDGSYQRLTEIGPGVSVGEIGLILQQPRAAEVIAIRDTSVAQLSQQQFEQLLTLHPVAFNRAITRIMFEYAQQGIRRPPKVGATTFAVVPLDDKADTAQLCIGIKQALSQYGKVHHFTPEEGGAFHTRTGASQRSNDRLSDFEQRFDYLLYEASVQGCAWSSLAVRQADQLILVANYDTDPWLATLRDNLPDDLDSSMALKSLVLLHPDSAQTATVHMRWHEVFNLQRIYPLRGGRDRDIERLVRFITDRAIGLVLGGGGARGLAHIGVLQALHESNIPIDMVCGNSMGALIGAQYIHGTPITDLLERTRRFVRGGERPTLPLFSLLSGHRVRRDLQQMFGDTLVETLWQPFFAVSCNLTHASINTHENGPLWQSVLASNSPAGILPPVILKGELLVDAALLDNVPVKAMRQRLGFGTLIAIDVDVSDELKVDPTLEQLSSWQVLRQRLFNRKEDRLPGILDLLNRAGHLGGLANRQSSKAMADHYWQPPVSTFSLMGYAKGEDIVAVGYQYAMQQIDSAGLSNTPKQVK
ncbi:MAG: putative acylesterase/phospholipase RssA/CRP-like cAMP-binding protein [Alteromonadaceae bacterium]|jgi:predicted acylesterase/phospholipase RssA/CRP-like cAMP-binding protein